MTICSHTIVKNGMPFVVPVLKQVEPFVDHMIVTVSQKSSDGTKEAVEMFEREFPHKIEVNYENVGSPGELTGVRQAQVDMTKEDWILFLDDDDWWPTASLLRMNELLDEKEDVDAYAVTPYQLIGEDSYDHSWRYKYFTKLFRNQKGINYKHPWPRDLIYLNDDVLYWRKNPRVKKIGTRFIHLSNIKGHSFRTETWAREFESMQGTVTPVPDIIKEDIKEIYRYKNEHDINKYRPKND